MEISERSNLLDRIAILEKRHVVLMTERDEATAMLELFLKRQRKSASETSDERKSKLEKRLEIAENTIRRGLVRKADVEQLKKEIENLKGQRKSQYGG